MGRGFCSASLSFVFASDHKDKYIADGAVLDPTELLAAFYNMLLQRHTNPGDMVVDLQSGSGALANHALCACHNTITLATNEERMRWICNRLHSAEYSSSLVEADLGGTAIDECSSANGSCQYPNNIFFTLISFIFCFLFFTFHFIYLFYFIFFDYARFGHQRNSFSLLRSPTVAHAVASFSKQISCIRCKCEIHEESADFAGSSEGGFPHCSKESCGVSHLSLFFLFSVCVVVHPPTHYFE
jgi:hypothetical protein